MRPRPSALAVALLLAGCGGHAGHPGGASRAKGGRAVLSVRWPARGRLIPNAANSLFVSVMKADGAAIATQTVARPADGTSTTQTTFSGLPYGSLAVRIEARPNADGTGVVQATGAGTMTVAEDVPGQLVVALDSTASTLAITPAAPTLLAGKEQTLVASAQDAAGNVVLLAAGGGEEALDWASADPSVATVAGTGASAILTAVRQGTVDITARLKVRDDGSTIASTPVPVRVVTRTAFLLASGGFPKDHGDRGNTGRADGRGATGVAGWTASVGSAAVGSLIVGPDGMVYVASGATVAALGPDGSERWRHTVEGTVSGLLLTQGGQLYVTGKGLTALDASTGGVAWEFATPRACYAPNVAADGTIYLPTNSDFLYALDPSDRTVLWKVDSRIDYRDSAVAVADDGTIVSRVRYSLKKITPTGASDTLRAVLGFGFDPEGISTPCIAGNEIVYQIDSFGVTDGGYRDPSPSYYYSRSVESRTTTSRDLWTHSLFSYSGKVRPVTYTPLPGAAVSPDGTFVRTVAGAPTTLQGFKNSQQTFSLELTPTEGASFSGDGVGYVATSDARLVAFDPMGGTLLWSISLPATASGVTPAIGPDGTLYVGTVDGRVVQVR